jgi:hypothetical protein
VAASIFGGTGASLLPVVRGCVENVLQAREDRRIDPNGLRWNAVKMLPHYEPTGRADSVDPDRFLLDTASALQFYSTTYRRGGRDDSGPFDGIYLVGSDRPGRNRVKVAPGHKDQANPAYFEELLAGLSVMHAAAHADEALNPVRLFQRNEGKADIGWDDLPFDGETSGLRLREQFGYLLHLAAFCLRQGRRAEPFSKGALEFLRDTSNVDLAASTWYQNLIDPWAEERFAAYRKTAHEERPGLLRRGDESVVQDAGFGAMREEAADYFGRLLLWADTALRSEDLALLNYQHRDYASIYHGMSSLGQSDVETQPDGDDIQPEGDNALVRMHRAALATMLRLHHRDIRLKVSVEEFQLTGDNRGRIALNLRAQHVRQALREAHLGDVADEFTRTAASRDDRAPAAA